MEGILPTHSFRLSFFLGLLVYRAYTVAILGALRYKGVHAVVLIIMTPCCPTVICDYLFGYQMLETKSELGTVMNLLRQFQLSLIYKVNFVLITRLIFLYCIAIRSPLIITQHNYGINLNTFIP